MHAVKRHWFAPRYTPSILAKKTQEHEVLAASDPHEYVAPPRGCENSHDHHFAKYFVVPVVQNYNVKRSAPAQEKPHHAAGKIRCPNPHKYKVLTAARIALAEVFLPVHAQPASPASNAADALIPHPIQHFLAAYARPAHHALGHPPYNCYVAASVA